MSETLKSTEGQSRRNDSKYHKGYCFKSCLLYNHFFNNRSLPSRVCNWQPIIGCDPYNKGKSKFSLTHFSQPVRWYFNSK